MHPREFFRYCPRCGAGRPAESVPNPFVCIACGFVLFFNPAVSAGAFLRRSDGRFLWLKRARHPAPGKLGLPGGFIDIGESAEAALVREAREEVGLELRNSRLLCTLPNEYEFRNVTYPVLDLIFLAEVGDSAPKVDPEEVESIVWLLPHELDPATIAFPSVRTAFLRHILTGSPTPG